MTDIADRYFAASSIAFRRFAPPKDPRSIEPQRPARKSIAADKLVFSFGTGHGSLPALEMFPRTGTIVGFRPIVESTMISFHHVWGDMGARQYRFIHAVEGLWQGDPADLISSTQPTRWCSSRTPA